MKQDLVAVYEAATVGEAQLLKNRLESAGIRAFIDNDDSPLDGLTAGEQTLSVRVLPDEAERARPVVASFEGETG